MDSRKESVEFLRREVELLRNSFIPQIPKREDPDSDEELDVSLLVERNNTLRKRLSEKDKFIELLEKNSSLLSLLRERESTIRTLEVENARKINIASLNERRIDTLSEHLKKSREKTDKLRAENIELKQNAREMMKKILED